MNEQLACALCQRIPSPGEAALRTRLLVPKELLEGGVFDLDPLGTAGASVQLCSGCVQALATPMLLSEDVSELARAFALHGERFGAASERESVAKMARLWHRALHLGIHALVGELLTPAETVEPRAGPDQLGLFASKTARLAKVEAALGEGQFEEARALAKQVAERFELAEARYLAEELGPLAERVAALRGDLESLAQQAEHPERLLDTGRVPPSVTGALARGLFRVVAQGMSETALVQGRPAGWYWLKAGDRARAMEHLERADAAGLAPGMCLTLLGNLAYEAGDVSRARELYRRAFVAAPEQVPLEEISDPAARETVEEARELDLDPPSAWVPIVGHALGLFRLPEDPEGRPDCQRAHALLQQARRERPRGEVAARRQLKQLAPGLFALLLEKGMV